MIRSGLQVGSDRDGATGRSFAAHQIGTGTADGSQVFCHLRLSVRRELNDSGAVADPRVGCRAHRFCPG
jgi:hypothetical protein